MNLFREKKYSWVSNKIEVRDSDKAGMGTFASETIAKDEILVVHAGRIVSIQEIDANVNGELDLAYFGFQIKRDLYIFPIVNNDKFIIDGIFSVNHSCSPNVGFKDMLTLVSMRDIQVNEEICYDYACTDVELSDEIPWHQTACHCKSKNCRGTITGSDWLIPEIQSRYHGFFSPYVQELIEQNTSK